jgi:hypothetical protein
MAQTVQLIFAAPVRPEEVRALVEAMGGVRSPHTARPNDTSLERDRGRVWVAAHPVDEVGADPGLLHAYARVLGAWPRSRVELEVSRQPGSERLAVEIVLAAAARWHLVLHDFTGMIITLREFRSRLSRPHGEFFLSERPRRAPQPGVALRPGAAPVTLILPAVAGRTEIESLLRSLGAEFREDAEAGLSRDGGHIRVRLHRPGDGGSAPGHAASVAYVLGDPLAYSVTLEVVDGGERSRLLALAVIEAIAAQWRVAIRGAGTAGRLMTIGELRALVAAGAHDLFGP